jgi:hypothetical protein
VVAGLRALVHGGSPRRDPQLVRFLSVDVGDAELLAGGGDETILEPVAERVADEPLVRLGAREAEPVADPFDAAAAGEPAAERQQFAPVPEVSEVIGGPEQVA